MAKLKLVLLASVLVCIKMQGVVTAKNVAKGKDTTDEIELQFNESISAKSSHQAWAPPIALADIINRRDSRSDMQIEDKIISSEDVTKNPRKHKRRTKRPTRKNNPESEEDTVEIEDDDDIVREEPPKKGPKPGQTRPKPKPEKHGKIYFEETFSERSWETSWIYSKMEYGDKEKLKKYEKFYRIRTRRGDKGFAYGLVTSNKGSEDYAISAPFQPISSNDGPLVVQFGIQYQSTPHCLHVNLRLMDCKFKPEEFTTDSPYLIQIGPNICGNQKHFNVMMTDPVKGEHFNISNNIHAMTSTDVHTYAFIIQPDGYYQILINDKSVQNGSLTSIFPNYQGFPSICAVGLNIWHSILDKFFLGQIIIDDILITSDVNYAEKRRMEILDMTLVSTNNTDINAAKKSK